MDEAEDEDADMAALFGDDPATTASERIVDCQMHLQYKKVLAKQLPRSCALDQRSPSTEGFLHASATGWGLKQRVTFWFIPSTT